MSSSTITAIHLERVMTFIEKLKKRWSESQSLLCVGLDPDFNRFPAVLKEKKDAYYEFCTAIVDATAQYACAFKPQIAYFASCAAEAELKAIIAYIHEHYPSIPVVLDSKRGDIGSTAKHYAKEAFERYGADAVTLSPYMGFDSVQPYLEYEDKGAILLCRTSNPGGNDIQMLEVNGKPIYQHVAQLASGPWNLNGQLGLVVGATYPNEIAAVRSIVGDMPLLVPGVGAQGGDIHACVTAGITAEKSGMMINSSRAILYASSDEDFKEAAARVAMQTRDKINQARA